MRQDINMGIKSHQSEKNSLIIYSAEIRALIETNPNWKTLIQLKKFEEEKALLSMKCTKQDLRATKPKTFSDVFANTSPSLATLTKYRGEIITSAVLHKLIYEIKNFFNVGLGITDIQIEILVELIFEEYHHYSIADFKLCFRKAMKGEYGEQYNRVDGAIIMGWLKKYNAERVAVSERLAEKEENLRRKDAKNIKNPRMKKELQAILAKMKEKEEAKEKSKRTYFKTIGAYVKQKGGDVEKVKKELHETWEKNYNAAFSGSESSLTLEQYKEFRYNEELFNINNNRGEVGFKYGSK